MKQLQHNIRASRFTQGRCDGEKDEEIQISIAEKTIEHRRSRTLDPVPRLPFLRSSATFRRPRPGRMDHAFICPNFLRLRALPVPCLRLPRRPRSGITRLPPFSSANAGIFTQRFDLVISRH
jgi:hypothetical protein